MISENLPAYLSTWSDEILSKANRVRNLIGSKHWLTDGTYKEFLVREFLIRHLPASLNISRGFVRNLNDEEVSPEIDLIVSDPSRQAPLFREGDFQIVSPSSVIGTFEIKSIYRKAVLEDSLSNVVRVRSVSATRSSPRDPWSAVMVVSHPEFNQLQEIADDLAGVLMKRDFWEVFSDSAWRDSRATLLPSIICLMDGCVAFLDGANDLVEIRLFSTGMLSTAIALSQFFNYTREKLTGDLVAGEIEELMARFDGLQTVSIRVKLPTL